MYTATKPVKINGWWHWEILYPNGTRCCKNQRRSCISEVEAQIKKQLKHMNEINESYRLRARADGKDNPNK